MFDFLFKRKSKDKSESTKTAEQNKKADSFDNSAQHRLTILADIDRVKDDEVAVISILLKTDFADGRLKAVQYIHSESGLQKVLDAMKKQDRRVAKLFKRE